MFRTLKKFGHETGAYLAKFFGFIDQYFQQNQNRAMGKTYIIENNISPVERLALVTTGLFVTDKYSLCQQQIFETRNI